MNDPLGQREDVLYKYKYKYFLNQHHGVEGEAGDKLMNDIKRGDEDVDEEIYFIIYK